MKNYLLTIIIIICYVSCNSQKKQRFQSKQNEEGYTFKTATPDGIGKYYFGREIAHVMGAQGSEWLERDTRDQEENTNLAIEKINIPLNGRIADVGAGTGYYSFKLSKKVPQGKVFAVELQDELINYLKTRKTQLKDSVVEIIKSSDHLTNLPENSIDLAILVDVYHEFDYPHEMLQSIRKALKPNGKILLLEYRGEYPSVPIKPLHKTSVAQLNKELGANGFKLNYRGEFLPIQHFLLYEKIY